MRTQRRAPLTVQLITVTKTGDDGLGNFTKPETSCTVRGATFEPERPAERAGEDQAPVMQPAAFNVPGCHHLGANDQVRCNGATWYVVGGSTVWLDRTNIPVSQTRVQ